MVLPLPGAEEEEGTARFRHARQVQSPVPWPAADPTPTLSIPTLLPAVVLNALVFHDAKHPGTAACLPQCQASQQRCIPTMVHNIPAPLPAFHTAQTQHPNPADSGPQPHKLQEDVGLCLHPTGELRQGAGSGHCRDSSICGMQGAGQPPSLLLSGAAFPAWAAAWPLPLPVAPAEGPCPHRGHRPGEGLNGNLMAGLPEIAKPLGKATPPPAGKSGSVISAVSELCLQPVSSQPRVNPRGGAAPGVGHAPPWLMVSPPHLQPWETKAGGWQLMPKPVAATPCLAAWHRPPWLSISPSSPAHLGTQKPVPGPSWYHSPGILAAGA